MTDEKNNAPANESKSDIDLDSLFYKLIPLMDK